MNRRQLLTLIASLAAVPALRAEPRFTSADPGNEYYRPASPDLPEAHSVTVVGIGRGANRAMNAIEAALASAAAVFDLSKARSMGLRIESDGSLKMREVQQICQRAIQAMPGDDPIIDYEHFLPSIPLKGIRVTLKVSEHPLPRRTTKLAPI